MGTSNVTQKVSAHIADTAKIGHISKDARFEDEYDMLSNILGSGQNGHVKLAIKKSDPTQKVAIKRLDITNRSKEWLDAATNEVKNHICMDHSHIARLFDVFETWDHKDLVIEYLAGGELFDRVTQRKNFSEEDACHALCQMLLAVDYMHSHGIVHRDLKLENWVYEEQHGNHLKLIDFGFSVFWTPGSADLTKCCGTIGYCAPEVFDKSYTSQCDMWSLGVIGFILLSGKMPFFGSEHKMITSIQACRYDMNSGRWGSISQETKKNSLSHY
jgi:calcium-dependent protein kinase